MSKRVRKIKEMVVWCDLETTGIDEYETDENGEKTRNEILEVALAVTDRTVRVLHDINIVVHSEFPIEKAHPAVQEMHTRNGLWEESRRSTITLENAEKQLIAFLRHANAESLPMAGSTVHFDRGWLNRDMPELEQLFHYRNFDVTTLRAFFDVRCGPTTHRALPDIFNDVNTVRMLLELPELANTWLKT